MVNEIIFSMVNYAKLSSMKLWVDTRETRENV